jgi:hypothetical protein
MTRLDVTRSSQQNIKRKVFVEEKAPGGIAIPQLCLRNLTRAAGRVSQHPRLQALQHALEIVTKFQTKHVEITNCTEVTIADFITSRCALLCK